MLYMSDDRKEIFKTEQECLEYEQNVEQERIKREKLDMERQNRLNSINKKHEDLQKDILDFKKDYGIQPRLYSASFLNFLDMMGR